MLELLAYPPVLRGMVLLLISGFTFPLGGVFILRMNLLPLRYLLMHGVLLGGALGLALGQSLTFVTFAVNILLVLLLNQSTRYLKTDYGHISMFLMVTAVGAASVVTSVFHVPAKDTLVLLWGSLYANSPLSLVTAGAIGLGVILFAVIWFPQLTAVFYDKELARSLGIRVTVFELVIMLITSFIVASAMQLMGALLLDAQLILPVVIAGIAATGLKQTMVLSCLIGGLLSAVGFFLSLFCDIPVSAGVALPAALLFIIFLLIKRGKKH